MMRNNTYAYIQQRKFKSDLLRELGRIADALERLVAVCDSCNESTTDEEIHDFRVQTGSLQPGID